MTTSMAGPNMMMRPQIILLKEGTDASQGKGQLLSNINACLAVVEVVKSTLGPRGMDKLILDSKGKTTISNDGATILKLLEIAHPAARCLVDIARSQDAEVGDGTTSVVILAGELLAQAKPFIEEGMSPRLIIESYRLACSYSLSKVAGMAVTVPKEKSQAWKEALEMCSGTAMNSKLIAGCKERFKKLVVDAVLLLDAELNEKLIGMKKIPGGALQDTELIEGVAFKKTFSYAGFEQAPKKYASPKIICLNIELELKAERDNAEIRVDKVSEYQSIVEAEWTLILEKLEQIVASGANVVLSRLPIGDLATQYFADRGIFCAGRVPAEDLARVLAAVGGSLQTSVNDLHPEVLGSCGVFEEKQVGNERYNFFTQCNAAKTCTFLIRGGSEQFMSEVERSLHDALCIARRTVKSSKIVAGGGAVEMELSARLREYSRSLTSKKQLLIQAFARAFEAIPKQLCLNAGFEASDLLNQLRKRHATDSSESLWYGVDVEREMVGDMWKAFVWEPSLVKTNLIAAATEATCLILSIDETVKTPTDSTEGPPNIPPGHH